MNRTFPLGLLVSGIALAGCAAQQPPIHTVPHVDLPRFMGDWYVIANIPTFVEKDAYNAVESYRLDADGTIATTFTFRKGGFDGEVKRYQPRGFVYDTQSNAVWGMQFIWPFKGDFRIVYLNTDYTQTVIGREKRDYVWIMARQPTIPDADYRHILELLAGAGYDTTRIQKVPQRWGLAQPANEDVRRMDRRRKTWAAAPAGPTDAGTQRRAPAWRCLFAGPNVTRAPAHGVDAAQPRTGTET